MAFTSFHVANNCFNPDTSGACAFVSQEQKIRRKFQCAALRAQILTLNRCGQGQRSHRITNSFTKSLAKNARYSFANLISGLYVWGRLWYWLRTKVMKNRVDYQLTLTWNIIIPRALYSRYACINHGQEGPGEASGRNATNVLIMTRIVRVLWFTAVFCKTISRSTFSIRLSVRPLLRLLHS